MIGEPFSSIHMAPSTVVYRLTAVLVLAFALALPACSVFSTRDPEPPLSGSGSFIQPDTPEQVVENVTGAVADMNTLNYRRSFAENFEFQPTAAAAAREPVFASWSRSQEEQYFTALAAAAELSTGHSLQLNDESFTLISPTRFELDATYRLLVNHRRSEAPNDVQGRLQWIVEQRADGLWEITVWTDREIGGVPSWSDLKAEFLK